MLNLEAFDNTFMGLWLILCVWIAQALIASMVKAKQPNAVPGKINENLSHESFVFRTHRTFMNSIENIPIMIGTVFLAIFINTDVFWTTVCVWIFALSRLVHMILYYIISTEKNPSPRSYFYLCGVIANVALLGICGFELL